MSNLIISGASDDLIEIDGLIADEFNTYTGVARITVKVDDAVHLIATAEYDRDDDGEWRIEVAGNFPDATSTWTRAVSEDEDDERVDEDGVAAYSDKLIVHLPDVDARRIDVTCDEAAR